MEVDTAAMSFYSSEMKVDTAAMSFYSTEMEVDSLEMEVDNSEMQVYSSETKDEHIISSFLYADFEFLSDKTNVANT
jgi:hypothetical protein